MGVYHRSRKAKPWRVQVREKGQPSVDQSFATEAEARAFEAATILAMRRGERLPEVEAEQQPEVVILPGTVAEACQDTLRAMRAGVALTRTGAIYKPQTIKAYDVTLVRHVLPLIGGMGLQELTRADVVRLREHIALAQGINTAKYAAVCLSAVLRRARNLGMVEDNVATGLPPMSAPRKDPIRFLTVEEADLLQAAADQTDMGTRVAVALATGIRRGELEGLQWQDVEDGELWVRRQRYQDGKVGLPKNEKERRVPFGPDTARRLKAWRIRRGVPDPGEWVFPTEHWHRWDKVRGAVPEPPPRWHDLRHTAATFWLAAGITVHAVADLLGHEDATLVLKLYGHALPQEKNTAGEVMDAFRRSAGKAVV